MVLFHRSRLLLSSLVLFPNYLFLHKLIDRISLRFYSYWEGKWSIHKFFLKLLSLFQFQQISFYIIRCSQKMRLIKISLFSYTRFPIIYNVSHVKSIYIIDQSCYLTQNFVRKSHLYTNVKISRISQGILP